LLLMIGFQGWPLATVSVVERAARCADILVCVLRHRPAVPQSPERKAGSVAAYARGRADGTLSVAQSCQPCRHEFGGTAWIMG
jgi:hypothetical protein